MEDQTLRFSLFGDFSVSYGGNLLKLDKSGTTKMIQLLAMLIYFRNGLPRETVLRNLYGERELADQNNNLRVTLFKLRKSLLKAGLPKEQYVSIQNGVYRWESSLTTTCDTWDFQQKNATADRAEKAGAVEQELNLRRELCSLYTDELLQKLSGEEWVLLEQVALKKLYFHSLSRLIALLEEQREFEEIIDLCRTAERLYPYDEWQLRRIDALMSMDHYDEAMTAYQEVSELYFKELGLEPTTEMLHRYEKMTDKLQRRCYSLREIYWEMVEAAPKGACGVDYLSFIDRFRYLQRLAERSGESNFLVSITVLQKRTGELFALSGDGDWADVLMRRALRQCLRRTDSFTKYSDSQYLMLLVGISLEALPVVLRRIDQSLLQTSGGRKLRLRYQSMAVPAIPSEDSDESGWNYNAL